MVGDTIYRPQGLVAYLGGTVSGPIRSLIHVPLDGAERTRIRKKKGGGVGCTCMVSGWGGGVTCPDVIVVCSRKGMLGGRTTIFFSCLFVRGCQVCIHFPGGAGAVYLSGMGGRVGTGGGK